MTKITWVLVVLVLAACGPIGPSIEPGTIVRAEAVTMDERNYLRDCWVQLGQTAEEVRTACGQPDREFKRYGIAEFMKGDERVSGPEVQECVAYLGRDVAGWVVACIGSITAKRKKDPLCDEKKYMCDSTYIRGEGVAKIYRLQSLREPVAGPVAAPLAPKPAPASVESASPGSR